MQSYPGAIGVQPVETAPQQQQQHVVLGIPISDGATAALAWKVMIVSALMVVLAAVQAAFAIQARDYSNIYVLLAFIIPICGWVGAKYNKPQLLRMFWVCNGLCSCLFVLVLIVNLAITVPNINCLCDDECFEERMDTEAISEEDRAEICDDKGAITRGIYISLAVGAVGAVLQTLGCTWGKQLEESNLFIEDTDDVPVAAVIGHPVEVRQQPADVESWPGHTSGGSRQVYPQQPGS